MASTPAGLLQRFLTRAKNASGINARPIVGQPIHDTHPEVIAEGDLMPGISAAEFAARREVLLRTLPDGAIALLPSAPPVYMTGAIPYPYRQDADFVYLTGITQSAFAVFGAANSPAPGYSLFVPEWTSHSAQWDGKRLERAAALSVFGADEAYSVTEMPQRLTGIVQSARRLLYDADRNSSLHLSVPVLRAAVEQARVSPLRPTIQAMRWRKSAAELELMRQSASAAAHGLLHCISLSQPGVWEHRLAAAFEYQCKMRGAQRMAYPLVTAGGASSTAIHYGNNDKVVRDGELLKMDAGCEMNGYASDVTRTWPVSGKFSPEQRAVYDIVLNAHRECVQRCRLGASLRDIHQHSIRLLSEGIADLRLFPGQSAATISRDAYRELYPHSVGHWLGMDTHDTASQRQDKNLQPGVVMTMEPGLYIPNEPRFGAFAGIGVRIEDDIAITEDGPEVLSREVPVDPEQIESLVGSAEPLARQAFVL